ncbi:MAG: hypothetical protein PHU64_01870 [Candidatus Omnitrophica bacterium]|nr:hypothetical protein [Candidatus Omnitrophota bacterium]MDD5430087.1 hypothetical protein [Candidatus Omnitrophota bacterium]
MTTHIKDILSGFFSKQSQLNQQREKAGKAIKKVFTIEEREGIFVKQILENEVVLYSPSSSCTYNITLKRKTLLEEINKELPKVKKITIHTR